MIGRGANGYYWELYFDDLEKAIGLVEEPEVYEKL